MHTPEVCCGSALAPAARARAAKVRVRNPVGTAGRSYDPITIPATAFMPQIGLEGLRLFSPPPFWRELIIG